MKTYVTNLTHLEHVFSAQRQKLSVHKNKSYIVHVYYYVCTHKALTANNRSPPHLVSREGIIFA